MGKMKELFMAMREANWEGTSHEFLLDWLKKEAKRIDKQKENENNNSIDDNIVDINNDIKRKPLE